MQVPKHMKMAWKSWSTPSPGRVHPTLTATKATPKRKKRNRPAGGPQRNLEARKNLPSPSRSSPAPRQADPTIILPTWSPLARKKVKKMQKKTGRKKEKRAWLIRNGRSGTSLAQSRKSPTPKLPSRRRGDLRERRSRSRHVGGNRSRSPRRGAQGLAQEPPACTASILPLPP